MSVLVEKFSRYKASKFDNLTDENSTEDKSMDCPCVLCYEVCELCTLSCVLYRNSGA